MCLPIALDQEEQPVILFAAFPDDLNHHYYYTSWNDNQWLTHHIVNSGRWFPQTPEGASEPEPNYSGGMVLDPNDPSSVYLSMQVNGVFEIYKYTTNDRGANWETTAITENTPEGTINVRPIVPQGHKPGSFDVIWLRGAYVTYANYLTSVMYYSPNTLNANLDSILIDGVRLKEFQPDKTNYAIALPSGTVEIPEVQGYSNVPFSQIKVTQATTLHGQALISVASEGQVTNNAYVIEFVEEVPTSVSSESLETVNIYPNPSKGEVNIDLSQISSIQSISLIDMNGKELKRLSNVEKNSITFSIEQLKEGIYFIKIISEQGTIIKKIVKRN